MPRIQGVGPRIAARIVQLGYAYPDGRPMVREFARAFHYDKTLVYEWIADRRTPTKDVGRLCRDLQVSHGWLLYGEGGPPPVVAPQTPLPISGGSGAGCLPSVDAGRQSRGIMSTTLARLLAWWARPMLSPGYAA